MDGVSSRLFCVYHGVRRATKVTKRGNRVALSGHALYLADLRILLLHYNKLNVINKCDKLMCFTVIELRAGL